LPAGISRIALDPTDNSIIAKGTPEALKELRRIIGEWDVPMSTQSIAIKNVAAQYLYDLLTLSGKFSSGTGDKGFLPEGVKIEVDLKTNSIVLSGPDEDVREMAMLVPQFDVRPRQLTLEVKGAIPSMGRTISSTGQVVNNSTWTYVDESADTKLLIRPLVNGDGSITLSITGTVMGARVQSACRLTADQTYYLRTDSFFGEAKSPMFVNNFYRTERIDEDAFLRGAPMASLDPDLSGDTTRILDGELRLIVRAAVVNREP
jgi:type II secretory pathway component GspD/PulD (secretin)